jgi:predicted nucleic acid-binding protein
LLRAALTGKLPFAISPLLSLEYDGILDEKIRDGLLKISYNDGRRILDALYSEDKIIWKPIQIRPVLSDPADDKILECAISGGCSHIITFNKRHFPAEKTIPWGIDVMTSGEFLIYWRVNL